jgi:hypothetical protein
MNETEVMLCVFTESALESQLIHEITRRGALGYTITNARGKGSSGTRAASWEANSNIKLEIICSESLAQELGDALRRKYAEHYAMMIFTSPINVLT